MDDRQFLEKLAEVGLLPAAQISKLLNEAQLGHQPVEELLYERRLVDEEEVAKVKSGLLGIAYKAIDPQSISDEVLQLLPEEIAVNYQAIPLGKEGNMLVVGMLHPNNRQSQDALRFIAKQKRMSLGIYLITPTVLEAVKRRYLPFTNQVRAAVRSLQIKPR
jgi:hypothetical protein